MNGVLRRALLVTHYFPAHGGGVEIVAGQIARRLERRGVETEWFASDTDSPPNDSGVTCKPQRAFNGFERGLGVPFPLWTPAAMIRLAKAASKSDVVHIHDAVYPANFFAGTYALATGKRLVVTQHIGFVPYRSAVLRAMLGAANRVVARLVLKRAHAVIFVSPIVRAYFEEFVGQCAHFLDIANGVDTDVFDKCSDEQRELIRRSFDLGKQASIMLFVGRFVEKKGLQFVRELATRTPDWTWLLVGNGPIDPNSWGLANVRVLGQLTQSELVRYYHAADALVLPSVGEGFPLVVQEALSAGLPVAVHDETRDAGALPNAVCIAESVHGDRAPKRWIEKLRDLIAEPNARRQARRVECRDFARSRWSWDVCCDRYERVLFADATRT